MVRNSIVENKNKDSNVGADPVKVSTLYIVATPIGNLLDISKRGMQLLESSDLIIAEDTRVGMKLLLNLAIQIKNKTFISYHDYSSDKKRREIFAKILHYKQSVLISDAGTPLISDPGYKLVQYLISQGVAITHVPGACSVINALVVSGLPSDKFAFFGFIPNSMTQKRAFLQKIRNIPSTMILFDKGRSLVKSLQSILDVMGDRVCCVCRELTKKYEYLHRAKISEAVLHYSIAENLSEAQRNREVRYSLKGEFVIVLQGYKALQVQGCRNDLSAIEGGVDHHMRADVIELVEELYQNKLLQLKINEIAEIVRCVYKDRVEISKNDIYSYCLKLKKESNNEKDGG